MSYQFPPDVEKLVQEQMQQGQYATEDDVLRDALFRLAQYREDTAAIAEGIEDMEAGRYRSFEEFDAEFRQKNGTKP